jgi:hypothetical protein
MVFLIVGLAVRIKKIRKGFASGWCWIFIYLNQKVKMIWHEAISESLYYRGQIERILR